LKTRIFPNMPRSHGELFSSVQSNSQAGSAYERKDEHDSNQTLPCRLSDIHTNRKALSHFSYPSKNPLHSMPGLFHNSQSVESSPSIVTKNAWKWRQSSLIDMPRLFRFL
jgi:hypothetical protein